MNKAIFPIFFLLIIAAIGCKEKKNESPIPYAEVNISLNLNDARYMELNTIGGFLYLTANYPSNGIIVYRKSFEEYLAFERTCTFEPLGDCCMLYIDDSFTFAEDTCCGSQFLLLDGSPLAEAPAKIPLKQYRTALDGSILHIYN